MATDETVMERHLRLQKELGYVHEGGAHGEDIPLPDTVALGGKAEQILRNLYPDEPVFILRGKDLLSVLAVQHYVGLLEAYSGNTTDQVEQVIHFIQDLLNWQRANPDKVKLPD